MTDGASPPCLWPSKSVPFNSHQHGPTCRWLTVAPERPHHAQHSRARSAIACLSFDGVVIRVDSYQIITPCKAYAKRGQGWCRRPPAAAKAGAACRWAGPSAGFLRSFRTFTRVDQTSCRRPGQPRPAPALPGVNHRGLPGPGSFGCNFHPKIIY